MPGGGFPVAYAPAVLNMRYALAALYVGPSRYVGRGASASVYRGASTDKRRQSDGSLAAWKQGEGTW